MFVVVVISFFKKKRRKLGMVVPLYKPLGSRVIKSSSFGK